MKKRGLLSFGFLFLLTLALATCSSQSRSSGKTVIKVATGSDTVPFTYKKNDTSKGHDVDVVKAIFKDSKKYKTEFMTTAFDSILTGIDASCYQIAASGFNYNGERTEKYLPSDPVSESNYVITSAERTSYDSLDDLSGKPTEVISGSSYAQVLEGRNDKSPNKEPIRINYALSSTGSTTRVQRVENGTINLILYNVISPNYPAEDQDFNLVMTNVTNDIGDETGGLEYLLFTDTNEGTKLQKFVNKRIKELKGGSALAGLNEQYFGGDLASAID